MLCTLIRKTLFSLPFQENPPLYPIFSKILRTGSASSSTFSAASSLFGNWSSPLFFLSSFSSIFSSRCIIGKAISKRKHSTVHAQDLHLTSSTFGS